MTKVVLATQEQERLCITDDIEQVLALLDEVIEFEKDKHSIQLLQSSVKELEQIMLDIDALD